MSKMLITIPDTAFRLRHRVIYGDTDAGGVVYNGNYLRYFEMGRTEMMRSHDMPYSAIEQMGLILPVTETYLRYKAPARYDDLITIITALVEVKKVSCRFDYKIVLEQEDKQEQLLVKGFTIHACVNRQGRLTPLPGPVRLAMEQVCVQPG